MNSYERRYYQLMSSESKCISDLRLEIEGKVIDQDYDTAIKRCYDMIRSLETMKQIRQEKEVLDLYHAATNVFRKAGS